MIIWITGQSGSGKTTLANQMSRKNVSILDGDDIRKIHPTGFSKKNRWNIILNNETKYRMWE